MSAPHVSVLLPVRDARTTILAALRSVQVQSDPDFECVVVDDGSRDGSRELALEFARKDSRFSVLERPSEGLVPALNAGLAACRGELVARMDADDLMHRHRLRNQRAVLERTAALSGVGCHVRLFSRRTLSGGLRDYEAWLNSLSDAGSVRANAFVECPLAHPTWMIRRSVIGRHGYRDQGWAEDYDLLLRILADGGELGVVQEPLLFWRDGPRRASRTLPAYTRERFIACKAHFLARTLLREVSRYVLWGYGDTGRALCRALAHEGKLPRAILELHPGRLGQTIFGAPVWHRDRAAELREEKMVVSVAGAEARADIRARLANAGFAELRDFVIAA